MIGVTEDNFRSEEPELVRVESLDRSLSSDRHEYGSLNSAMSSGEAAVSGLGGRVGGKKLEDIEHATKPVTEQLEELLLTSSPLLGCSISKILRKLKI